MNKKVYEGGDIAEKGRCSFSFSYSAFRYIVVPPRTELELARMHNRFLADENYRLKRENERLKGILYD